MSSPFCARGGYGLDTVARLLRWDRARVFSDRASLPQAVEVDGQPFWDAEGFDLFLIDRELHKAKQASVDSILRAAKAAAREMGDGE
jgi:hypothetical protein